MKENFCEREQIILQPEGAAGALRDEELAAHAADCPVCREALEVAGWMRAFAAGTEPARAIPKPGFIWWKARLIERQRQAERAARPILWAQAAAAVLVTAACVWALISGQTYLARTWKVLSDSLALAGAPLLIVLAGALVAYLAFALLRGGGEPSGKN